MNTIKHLEWRYATKEFDATRKVNKADLEQLKRAVQLSVSSFGLQSYKILIIEDKEIREQLKPASWNQNQITDASHLFVFCNYNSVHPTDVDAYIRTVSEVRNTPIGSLESYRNSIKISIGNKTAQELKNWLERQPYLALSNLLSACAELNIDACPMEGFISEEYNKLLKLDRTGTQCISNCSNWLSKCERQNAILTQGSKIK